MSDNCLFCNIIAGQIPAKKVLETEHILAFYDIQPQAPIHILVIPKEHSACLSETNNPETLAQVINTIRTIVQEQNISDYRVVVNNGAEAGQSIFHLHAHLLAGRSFSWPPG